MASSSPASSPAALAAQSRAAWAAKLSDRYYDGVWLPFRAQMEEALCRSASDGGFSAEHAKRAKALLDAKVGFEPITLAKVDELAEFIGDKFLEGEPMSRETDISRTDLTALLRIFLLDRAVCGDPLSVVVTVDGVLAAAFVGWDSAEVTNEADAALAQLSSTSAAVAAILHAMETADVQLVAAMADVTKSSTGPPASDAPISQERWIEMLLGATSEQLRFFVPPPAGSTGPGAGPRSFAHAVRVGRMNDIAACGVYSHVNVHAHARSFPAETGALAQRWRKTTGAPLRSPHWDVHLELPYSALSLPGKTGMAMHAGVVQLRPRPTHYWA